MVTVLRVFQWLISIGLIGVVLLQPSRNAGMGVMGGGSENFMGRRKKGWEDLLSRLTVYLAIAFMITSISLAVLRR
ncbi:MAG TPA: preprotein translocase subunit SecG [Firmicutes bacterium]|nr:preprotein translocase subunit SecG [Candidatus Fermentithermobacillaceae bacterium]